MTGITLKQLKYVDALARHNHFGRAAAASAISQPALSVQIRDLESALGLPLFDRGARTVRLTGFGEEFHARARVILGLVDDLADLARASQDLFVGRLRIGVIPTVAPYLLPRVLARLGQAYPDLDVQIRETVTPRLVDELAAGRLDTAILALPLAEPGLEETVLFEERMVLVRPGSEAGRPVPSADALGGMRLLLLEEGHCFRDQALSFCNMGTGLRRDGLDGSSLSTLVQMVGSGIGVTLIPEMAVPVETKSAPVSIARFPAPEPGRTVGMVWRRSSPLAQTLTGIADLVRGAAGDGHAAA
ncbi:MAG: LysR substrate-binding domain-containing protein [Paracoccaceae bacterium]|nr:LysR substrate-binding domain-containing protein [Paracoccaceae bacterium]